MHRLDPQSLPEHVDRLFRAAWALCGSREDAEDLVQETFTRVLARPRWIRSGSDIAYLMRVLRNTFLTARRTDSRRPLTSELKDETDVRDDRPSLRPDAAAETHELIEAVADLPENFRLALVAVDVIGLSYAEAASALRVREATLATRVHRARAKVSGQFAEETGLKESLNR